MPEKHQQDDDANRIAVAIARSRFQGSVSQMFAARARARRERVMNRAIFRRPNPIPQPGQPKD